MLLVLNLLFGLANWTILKHRLLNFVFKVVFLDRRLVFKDLINFLITGMNKVFEKLIFLELLDKELHLSISGPVAFSWGAHKLLQSIKVKL